MSWIDEFLAYLLCERGLANNTIESYGRDLTQFEEFINDTYGMELEEVNEDTILSYLKFLKDHGKANSSISRTISAIRGFYAFTYREGLMEHDPATNIASPKQEKSLPQVLTAEEVTGLLDAPVTDTPAGIRDKAMLETMYATGMRVSELVSLDLGDIDTHMGVRQMPGQGMERKDYPHGERSLLLGRNLPPIIKRPHVAGEKRESFICERQREETYQARVLENHQRLC